MCAIAGMIGLSCDKAAVRAMLQTMERRGPDGNGIFTDGACTLLHSRLAIIDPVGGKQPMTVSWKGEEYTITYNGELYNTETIRRELQSCGHVFSTDSDTEVVLRGYAQWKQEALHRFNGIFAFGIWEKTKQRLFAARDRMGVKPLFYKLHDGGFLFASEIKTLLTYPGVEAKLDAEGVGQLLLLGPGRKPGSGVLKDIAELLPGECAVFANGRLQKRKYWTLRDREHSQALPETLDHLRWLVTDAISRQTVSDVPIGTFLSGGLDSSLITAVCADICRAKGEHLPTFSLDYQDNNRYFVPGKFQPSSDTEYIHLLDGELNTDHHWTVLSSEELVEELENATDARDLPGMADVDFSLLAFCRQIRSHVKVALSGECADEIFGGYPWFTDPKISALDGFPWAQNTMQRESIMHPVFRQQLNARDYVYSCYSDTVQEADILPGTEEQDRRMKRMMHLNMQWFMQTLLDRKDRMSMYCGLEVRVPFCDWRIAEYMYGMPWSFKNLCGVEKGLLRKAMEGVLPERILWRKKNPYPKTYDPAYLDTVSRRLEALLQDRHAPIFQLVEPGSLRGLLEAEYPWPWYGQLMRLPQTISYMLQLDYWLRRYKVNIVA